MRALLGADDSAPLAKVLELCALSIGALAVDERTSELGAVEEKLAHRWSVVRYAGETGPTRDPEARGGRG